MVLSPDLLAASWRAPKWNAHVRQLLQQQEAKYPALKVHRSLGLAKNLAQWQKYEHELASNASQRNICMTDSKFYMWNSMLEQKDLTVQEWHSFLARIGVTTLIVVCLIGVVFQRYDL